MGQADQVMANLVAGLRQARNDVIIEATANLMEPPDEGGTPVDSGWARGNWIPSPETPVESAVGSEGDAASAQAAQQEGIAKVSGYTGPGAAYVANNVPYIQRLNDGWSKQAPSGFVEAAVAKAEQTVQKQHDGKTVDVSVIK